MEIDSENTDSFWDTQHFIDKTLPDTSEDDPWDPKPFSTQNSHTSSITTNVFSLTQSNNAQKSLPVGDEKAATSPSLPSPQDELTNDYSDAPDDEFQGDYDADPDPELYDEPVPFAEYDPDLSEEIYSTVESIDLTDVEIRLDMFLSPLSLSEEEDKRIRNYLTDFSRARLSNWLPWLNSKEWTGKTLLLFIQFHAYWESNPEWWERRWHFKRYGWHPTKSPMSNVLSRDDAYLIVHFRIEFPSYEMIDPLWFDEWDYHSLWRYGFYSFAQFAKFRATLNEDEDWESLIDWQSADEDVEFISHLREYDKSIEQEDEFTPYLRSTSTAHLRLKDWWQE